MKIKYILISIMLLFCSFSSCNKKDDKPQFTDKYFKVEQFLVDGADSTLAVKNKPHYSLIYFVNDNRKTIIANPLSYNNHSGFSGAIGDWVPYKDSLWIRIDPLPGGDSNILGPYWSNTTIHWLITNDNANKLYLETDFEGKHYIYKLSVL